MWAAVFAGITFFACLAIARADAVTYVARRTWGCARSRSATAGSGAIATRRAETLRTPTSKLGAKKGSGTWAFNAALWDGWDRLFLGFHFGNAEGQRAQGDPDSFIVELARAATQGSWQLGGNGAKITGLSNLYLISVPCAGNCGTE